MTISCREIYMRVIMVQNITGYSIQLVHVFQVICWDGYMIVCQSCDSLMIFMSFRIWKHDLFKKNSNTQFSLGEEEMSLPTLSDKQEVASLLDILLCNVELILPSGFQRQRY